MALMHWKERSAPGLGHRGASLYPTLLKVVALLLVALLGSACVTVRPEQRAVLADPVMQFQGDLREAAQMQHVIDNREGSFGGSSVQGGGCGCN